MKTGLWQSLDKTAQYATLEETLFIPPMSAYRRRPHLGWTRIGKPPARLKPADSSMWGFLNPPQWDSRTASWGLNAFRPLRVERVWITRSPWAQRTPLGLPRQGRGLEVEGQPGAHALLAGSRFLVQPPSGASLSFSLEAARADLGSAVWDDFLGLFSAGVSAAGEAAHGALVLWSSLLAWLACYAYCH